MKQIAPALRSTRRLGVALGVMVALLAPALTAARAVPGEDLDSEPIRYTQTPAQDAVAELQGRLDRGEVTLRYDRKHGYMPAVLAALGIPTSSQMLVFSKTSFQRDRISPNAPRAIYFNDGAYVGWVQGGPVLELSTVDPQLGAVFYVLEQSPAARPKFVRQTYECLSCHQSSMTSGVPGHVVRSVFPARDGQPIFSAGTFVTSDESPLTERWGGWYVTGKHGAQRHMGNLTFKDQADAEQPRLDRGANVTDLRPLVDVAPYLSRHSDVVALMVIEHQTRVQNLITRASYETRRAVAYEELLNRELKRSTDQHSESTLSRVRSVAEPLAKALLFVNETPLTAPVQGTSGFAQAFAKVGPRDEQGRSLRDFDLQHRLFRYPCSYLVYSPQFDALPPLAKEAVYRRLHAVLGGEDTSPEFKHLAPADRAAILQLLRATKPDFAEWKPAS